MKRKFLITTISFFVIVTIQAQIVSDPMHTGITSLIKLLQGPSFKTIVDGINKLQDISSAVQQFQRGRDIVQSINRSVNKLNKLSNVLATDGHIYPQEYARFSDKITEITQIGTGLLKEMRSATTASGGVLEMSDAERGAWLKDTYRQVAKFEGAIDQYTNLLKGISESRNRSKYDALATAKLYGTIDTDSDIYSKSSNTFGVQGSGYDTTYSPKDRSEEERAKQEAQRKIQQKMRECQENQMLYDEEKSIVEEGTEAMAFFSMLADGWVFKNRKFIFNETTRSTSGGSYIAIDSSRNAVVHVPPAAIEQAKEIRDEADHIIAPDGRVVTQREFDVRMNQRAREMMRGQDAILRRKFKIDECLNVGE